jgi:hypothetical protein
MAAPAPRFASPPPPLPRARVPIGDALLTKRLSAQGVLSRYTTNQRLSILGLDDGDGKPKVVQQQTTLSDKVRRALVILMRTTF